MQQERIVWYGTVKAVEHRLAKRWVRGTGKDAEFAEDSVGWYLTFFESPVAAYAGMDEPKIRPGDRMKMSMEVVVR